MATWRIFYEVGKGLEKDQFTADNAEIDELGNLILLDFGNPPKTVTIVRTGNWVGVERIDEAGA